MLIQGGYAPLGLPPGATPPGVGKSLNILPSEVGRYATHSRRSRALTPRTSPGGRSPPGPDKF